MLSTIGRALLIPVVAGLLAGPLCAAEVYKWVDENGVVHYTDTPPERQQAEQVEISPPAATTSPPEASAPEQAATSTNWYEQWLAEQRERKALEKQRREEKTTVRRDEQTHMLEQCAQARQRLKVLETQCPVFFDGQGILRVKCPYDTVYAFKGDFRYLSDEERASMIAHYQVQLAECEELGY
jgi:hypothetical protein